VPRNSISEYQRHAFSEDCCRPDAARVTVSTEDIGPPIPAGFALSPNRNTLTCSLSSAHLLEGECTNAGVSAYTSAKKPDGDRKIIPHGSAPGKQCRSARGLAPGRGDRNPDLAARRDPADCSTDFEPMRLFGRYVPNSGWPRRALVIDKSSGDSPVCCVRQSELNVPLRGRGRYHYQNSGSGCASSHSLPTYTVTIQLPNLSPKVSKKLPVSRRVRLFFHSSPFASVWLPYGCSHGYSLDHVVLNDPCAQAHRRRTAGHAGGCGNLVQPRAR